MGREFSGVNEHLGTGVIDVAVGDTVVGAILHGAFTDHVVAPAD